jgi:hypothetical protein
MLTELIPIPRQTLLSAKYFAAEDGLGQIALCLVAGEV